MFYDVEMKRYSDHVNALAYAEEKGVGIGMKRAAKNMLKDGLDIARVARITNLPMKAVKALR